MKERIAQIHKNLNATKRSLIYPGLGSLALGATLGPTSTVSIGVGVLLLPWITLYIFFTQSSQIKSWKKTACGVGLLPLSFIICTLAIPIGGLLTGRPLETSQQVSSKPEETKKPSEDWRNKVSSSSVSSENLGGYKQSAASDNAPQAKPEPTATETAKQSTSESSDGKLPQESLIQSCAIGKVANDDGISAKYLIEQMLVGRGQPKYLANIIMEQMKPICPKVY
jgi:hypothetical protein